MPRYLVQTFGCQMNVHDSRRIEEVLEAAGWQGTDEAALADLVLFNTCSVREKAEHKLLSVLGTVRGMKEARPWLVVAVAGCVAQQEGERLLDRAPFVDLVLGPDNIPELPGLVAEARRGAPPIARTVFDAEDPRFLAAGPRADGSEVSTFVTVMKGCDERCTFCIVPTTRGPERYRPAADIVAEIRVMVQGGVREVTLLGQTVNSWHEPGEPSAEEGESRFPLLLRRIAAEVPELARLRYTSPHPRHLTASLVRAHAELDLLPAHVHLPVQSGSDRVLRRMLRRTTRAEYLARTRALATCRPGGVTLSTDFIVGFPGETRADFDETLSLVGEAGFVAAFAFKYSPRPGTPALRLGDDVPEAEKDERLARLLERVGEQQRAHLESLVGTTTTVLVEGLSDTRSDGEPRSATDLRWRGRSHRHEIVHVEVPRERDPLGALLPVVIERAHAHSLVGRADPAAVLALPSRTPRPPPAARVRLPVSRSTAASR